MKLERQRENESKPKWSPLGHSRTYTINIFVAVIYTTHCHFSSVVVVVVVVVVLVLVVVVVEVVVVV